MKKLHIITLVLLSFSLSIFAQVDDSLLPNGAIKYSTRDNWNVAIFPVDFTDIPSEYRSKFPSKADWDRILFQEDISVWYQDMSYGTTTITGDVFDYTTSSEIFFDTGNSPKVIPFQQVLSSVDFVAPGFDGSKYDYIVFIITHDAAVQQSITAPKSFTINGTAHDDNVVCVSYQNGIWWRNATYPESDKLEEKVGYIIPPNTMDGDDVVNYEMSKFETVLLHEIGHSMGLDNHSNTSTNGNKAAYETEIADNSNFMNLEYGNKYDLMGNREYGISMNGNSRDICGLVEQNRIYSKNWWGKTTVTVNPISSSTGKVFIEVLIPDQINYFGFKNDGYSLEVRTADKYNTMLTNTELDENTNGFFVFKNSGTTGHLLDMSPSDNITAYGDLYVDLRDVVLKSGMSYSDDDVLFENVVNNADGTWSVDITIKAKLIVTKEPTFTSATRKANGDIDIIWTNNCTDCQSDQIYSIYFREVGTENWNSIYDASLTSGSYTKSSLDAGKEYEFRASIGDNTTHYASLYSNTVSTSSLSIEGEISVNIEVFPNPTSDYINIISDNIESIELYTISGVKILEKSKSSKIDVRKLNKGIYILRVKVDGRIFIREIIKE